MTKDGKPSPLLVQQYFRVKARQLAAMANLPVCEHNTLAGSHREELQRIFLQEVLPRRFAVGRGMVYGPMHRSKEADIVIWEDLGDARSNAASSRKMTVDFLGGRPGFGRSCNRAIKDILRRF